MTSDPDNTWICGPCEVPHWDRRSAEALEKAFHAAGLIPRQVETVVDARIREAGAFQAIDSLRNKRYRPDSREEYRLELFASALEQTNIEAVIVSGDRWSLFVPLVSGWVCGYFDGNCLNLGDKVVADLIIVVFDLALSEWGIAGPERALRPRLPRRPFGKPVEPLPLIMAAPLTYLSPDMAYQVNLPGLASLPVKRVRTFTGGILLVIHNIAINLDEVLAPVLKKHARPEIHQYRLPDHTLLLRDVSPGLAQWQMHMADVAENTIGHVSGGLPRTLDGLSILEAKLRSAGLDQTNSVLEAWTAFAGEVAVACSGRWRRMLDPFVPYPGNLLVELENGRVFQPHPQLTQALQNGRQPSLVTALKELVNGRH